MAEVDEQTDLSNGMAVPLHVNVALPNSGIATFFAVSVRARMPAAVTGWPAGAPFMIAARESTGSKPAKSSALTLGFGFTDGAYLCAIAA